MQNFYKKSATKFSFLRIVYEGTFCPKEEIMSKRKVYNKHIIKGFFYHIHEGSPSGHPGMIFWKSDKKNLYLALTTDSSIGQHRTRLSAPTSANVRHSFVYNRPTLCKRKDIGSFYPNMRFSKKDKQLLTIISRRLYRETKCIRAKDRWLIKKLKKKPRY